jgi:hypothetical protein
VTIETNPLGRSAAATATSQVMSVYLTFRTSRRGYLPNSGYWV